MFKSDYQCSVPTRSFAWLLGCLSALYIFAVVGLNSVYERPDHVGDR
jgi:hypothetical protein